MTSIKNKVDYTRSQMARGASDHLCHWPGCTKHVPPALWGCPKHWFALPRALRAKIWAAFRPGQEISKDPSPAYLEAAREVQAWIATHEGKQK